MVGNFAMMFGKDDPTTLVLNADGTGTLMFAGEGGDITWTQKDANTISITAGSSTAMDVVYDDGALVLTMADAEFSGRLLFTKDGTYAKIKEISLADAKDITSEDALVGTWALTGMNLGGVTMYGDAADLAQLSGADDMTIVLEKGGTGKAFGDDVTWAVSSNGATITVSGVALPVKALGDNIVVDVTSATGNLNLGGANTLFLFSK